VIAVARVLLLFPLLAGCSMAFTTEVRVRDTSLVSLRAASEPARALLPEGRGPARVTVAKGWIPLRGYPGVRAPYAVDAVREEDGTMAFDDGYRYDVVSSTGQVRVLRGAVVSTEDLSAPELVLPMCATARVGKRSLGQGDCSPESQFRGQLVTPWSNVAEVRTIGRREKAQLGAGLALALGLILGLSAGVPLVVTGAGLPAGDSTRAPLIGAGSAVLIAPVLVFLVLAPAAFAPNRVEILFPPHGAQ
jgi:hypothetical protein